MPQISAGKILENDVPVFVVTFATQEMLLFRNVKTREIIVGAENRVEQCHYAAVVTRVEEELDNEVTGGWKIVEVCLDSTSEISLLIYLPRWRADLLVHTSSPIYARRDISKRCAYCFAPETVCECGPLDIIHTTHTHNNPKY